MKIVTFSDLNFPLENSRLQCSIEVMCSPVSDGFFSSCKKATKTSAEIISATFLFTDRFQLLIYQFTTAQLQALIHTVCLAQEAGDESQTA